MKYFLVILSVILLWESPINGLETNGVDVLELLKKEVPECKLQNFVLVGNHYSELTADLKQYCSAQEASKAYRLLCLMLAYEITTACKLDKSARPSPANYEIDTSADEICKRKNIPLTNQWILSKVDAKENSIGANDNNLCQKITESKNTLHLARFFYKIAPNVRKHDMNQPNKANADTNASGREKSNSGNAQDTKSTKDEAANTGQTAAEKSKVVGGSASSTSAGAASSTNDKHNEVNATAKNTPNQPAETVQKKTGEALEPSKNKTDQTVDVTKAGIADPKDKTDQAIDGTKPGADTSKDKTSEVGKKDKDKTSTIQSVLTSATTKAAESATEKPKPASEKVAATLPLNGTKDPAKDQDNKQIVLDLGKADKTSADKKDGKDQTDAEKPKDNLQKQIPPPIINRKTADVQEGEANIEVASSTVDNNAPIDATKTPDNGGKNKAPASNDGNEPDADDEDENAEDNANGKAIADDGDDDPDVKPEGKDKLTQNKADNTKTGTGKQDGNDRIKISKVDEEKKRKPAGNELKIPDPAPPKSRQRSKSRGRDYDDEGWSGSFVTYFLVFTLFVVVGYLILHNKNKLMAYALEGRRTGSSRTGSRPSHRGYEKLKNVNDVIPIDDTETVSNKDPTIIKT